MADAKKCDRCGYYFDNAPSNNILLPYWTIRDHNFHASRIAMVDTHGNYRHLDLCEKCLKAFNSYLNTPSKYMKDID